MIELAAFHGAPDCMGTPCGAVGGPCRFPTGQPLCNCCDRGLNRICILASWGAQSLKEQWEELEHYGGGLHVDAHPRLTTSPLASPVELSPLAWHENMRRCCNVSANKVLRRLGHGLLKK